jgi:hypothetical protein
MDLPGSRGSGLHTFPACSLTSWIHTVVGSMCAGLHRGLEVSFGLHPFGSGGVYVVLTVHIFFPACAFRSVVLLSICKERVVSKEVKLMC